MKRILAALAAATLVALGVVALPSAAFANGTISGTITNSSAVGINNAVIEFQRQGGTNYFYTGPTGAYTASMTPGTYTVYIHADGYAPEFFDDSYSVAGAAAVVVAEGGTLTISASLAAASVITGHITDYLNGPVDGQVFAVPSNGDDIDWFRGLTNPATGEYTIEDLSPGEYRIFATTTDNDDLVDEWFNDKYTQESATPVVITSTGSSSTIDVQLQLGGRVSGTVVNTIGSPVDLQVVLDGSSGPVNNTGDTYHGEYEIHGLLPDTYTATIHDYSGFFQDAASTPFTVTTATPATADLVVTPALPDESEFYAYPALSGPTTVQAGKAYTWTVQVSGDSDAYAILYSDPVFLGVAPQNDAGIATLTLTIPASTPAGEHKLTYSSYEDDGFDSRQYFSITVTAAAIAALPATGVDGSLPLAFAALLLLTGAALVGRRLYLR